MSYQIKRIDPYWITHPLVTVAAVLGAVVLALGVSMQKPILSWGGGILAALAVLAAAKPVVSAVLGTLGLFGGLVTFVILDNPQMRDVGLLLRLFSAGFFALLYMVLMDALVLAVACLYNFFGTAMGGLRLEFEEGGAED